MGGDGGGQCRPFTAPTHCFSRRSHEHHHKQLRLKTASTRHLLRNSSNGSPVPTAGQRGGGWGSSASYSGALSLNPISLPPCEVAVTPRASLNSSEPQFYARMVSLHILCKAERHLVQWLRFQELC